MTTRQPASTSPAATNPPPPHSYKEQRLKERRARESREAAIDTGELTLPPICGYTYMPRRPKNPNQAHDPTPVACMRIAGSNTDHYGKGFCDYHTWHQTVENNKLLATRNSHTQAMKQAEEAKRFFGNLKHTDPHTVLLEEIQRSASIVSYYEEKLQEFRELGMADDDIMTQATFKDGIKPSVWMDLFNTERAHLVKTCLAAIKAGVAERKVQIAEQQGRLIAAMMFAFMHDPELGLSPDQIMNAPRLIRKHLMNLPQQNPVAVDPAHVLATAPRHMPASMGAIDTTST